MGSAGVRQRWLVGQRSYLESQVDLIVSKLNKDKDTDSAEKALLQLRSKDARRQDMPEALRMGFVKVFEIRAEEDPEALVALAALEADHEAWDTVHKSLETAMERGLTSDFVQALALRARRSIWDWSSVDRDEALGAELVERNAISAFAALSTPGVHEDIAFRRCRRAVRQAIAATILPNNTVNFSPSDFFERPLVAVLTADANGAHPLSQLLPSALQAIRDYPLALISMCANDGSAERKRFEEAASIVIKAEALSPYEIAQSVANLKPAVLLDFCGHAGSNDLLLVVAYLQKLVPNLIIVNAGLGTPFVSGESQLYAASLCDKVVAPKPLLGNEPRLWMPSTYFCADLQAYRSYDSRKDTISRASLGLSETAVIIVCANRPHKVDSHVFDAWLDALRILESKGIETQLWILQPSSAGRRRALERSGDLANCLVFADRAKRPEHLLRLECADLAVDTQCYGSHTLACDYAWAGVPLITVYDENKPWHQLVGTAVTRSALHASDKALLKSQSILEASDWYESYVDRIVSLASDLEKRQLLRSALQRGSGRSGSFNKVAPLWNAQRWAFGLERGLDRLLEKNRKSSDPIDIPETLDAARCIVLRSSTLRSRHFQRHIKAKLPEVERVDAIEANDKPCIKSALASLGNLVVHPIFENVTAGQLACLSSHCLVWREIANDKDLAPNQFVLVLEDDAEFPLGPDTFRNAVLQVQAHLATQVCDLCYLYVYPTAWPEGYPLECYAAPSRTIPGFYTWCLVAYLISPNGARKLLDLLSDLKDIYAPIDCLVADFAKRGLLNVRSVDTGGFIDNAGQLDSRAPQPNKMPSNLWNAPPWEQE